MTGPFAKEGALLMSMDWDWAVFGLHLVVKLSATAAIFHPCD